MPLNAAPCQGMPVYFQSKILGDYYAQLVSIILISLCRHALMPLNAAPCQGMPVYFQSKILGDYNAQLHY